MAANWAALADFLRGSADTVTISWPDLDAIVGGMPQSSLDHSAWWGGDRPHTRAWKSAGFVVTARQPGVSVTFQRVGADQVPPAARVVEPPALTQGPPADAPATTPKAGRLLLIACGKAKAAGPSAAKDLYVSARFRKARAYAERSGVPWFIVSAEHGLVGPEEWLAPYERYLPNTPRDYRTAWGEWVAARLDLLAGPLGGRIVEIHAGEAYLQPLGAPLARRGARVDQPLHGLTAGRWQGWYDAHAEHPLEAHPDAYTDARADQPAVREVARQSRGPDVSVGDPRDWITRLGDETNAVHPADLAGLEREVMDGPGLYGWFIDAGGAKDLGRGLGVAVSPGLIYVGQTGATKWPSGTPSNGTLINRIRRQHLGGRRSSSTLRRTLGAILDAASDRPVSRDDLTAWMFAHLRVVPAITTDPASLGDLERQVVQALEPPLNLDHVGPTPGRVRLKQLRGPDPGSWTR
ncbi:hypothetical protein GCM10027270_35590 [Nocardioides ginkgobilobae]